MMQFDYVVNNNSGLGDCLSCFNTDKAVWSPSPHFQTLKKYSTIRALDAPIGIAADVCALGHDAYNNEHLFNRVRMVSGLEVLQKPRAILDLIEYRPEKNRIALSFDVGSFAAGQKHLHPRARELYDEHHRTIQEFISRHSDNYEFIEVGVKEFGFNNTVNMTGIGLGRTIETLSTCTHYFGMHSGMMHLATAVGIDCTIIINFPSMQILKSDSTEGISDAMRWEKSWLYPQHNYLHEDDSSITVHNLESAILNY
jgi:hypothetical protein